MKNSNSFSILFWTNKAKADASGYVPLYARVTIQGKRVEISLKKKLNPKHWDAKSGFMKGNSEEARTVNKYIVSVNNELFAIFTSSPEFDTQFLKKCDSSIYRGFLLSF